MTLDSNNDRERSLQAAMSAQASELKNLKGQLDSLSANRESKQSDYSALKSQQDVMRKSAGRKG